MSQEICGPRDHVWDEGDNDAIYCGVCNGYSCDACAATGYGEDGRKCYMCSGFGVVMWWESEWRWISPPNYLAAVAATVEGHDSA